MKVLKCGNAHFDWLSGQKLMPDLGRSPAELVESSLAPFAIMMIILSNPIFYPISEIVPINRLYNRGFCSNSNTGTPIRTNHPTTISDRKIESFRFLI